MPPFALGPPFSESAPPTELTEKVNLLAVLSMWVENAFFYRLDSNRGQSFRHKQDWRPRLAGRGSSLVSACLRTP